MSTILFITANPKKVENSLSLSLGQEFIQAYREAKPEDEIVSIDLYNTEIPELDYDLLFVIANLKKGITPEQLTEQSASKLERYNQFTDQFVKADKYIFVTPMWNLGLPSRVKEYIDTVCVAGKTFKYTEQGPRGLLGDKKCLHIHASGGIHSENPYNHADPYLRDVMKFMGVSDYKTLLIEGAAIPNLTETVVKDAHAKIPNMVEWFK